MTEISFSNIFVEPFVHAFMVRGLLISLMVAVICAVLSCYTILKGWALMGDAISHAVFPGIVLSFVFKIPIIIGAFTAGILCAFLTDFIKLKSRLKEDTVMGVVFSGLFALGLVIYSKIETDQHLGHILFGNLLGVTSADVWQTGILFAVVLLVVGFRWRDLLLYCFDPIQASMSGMAIQTLRGILIAALSLAIVVSLQAVGVILVVAMLITPGACGYLVTKQFKKMLLVSVVIAVFSSFVGLLLSYHFNASSGPCIVVTQAFIFVGILLKSLLSNVKSSTAPSP